MKTQTAESNARSFVETALSLGGKTSEEARRTGSLDRADEQVEALYAPRHQTAASPVHRAVWDREFPIDLFLARPESASAECERAMEASWETVRRHRAAGSLFDQDQKISQDVLRELAAAGYWGLLIAQEYGGTGAPFAAFAKFLTRMAVLDPNVAGLASVHGCIGAVDPLRTFGSPEQKARFLPRLASGERLSGFALTEPGAGSDLTALRTSATLDGEDYVVSGEKLFITNAVPGSTVALVCLIAGRPAVLIVDLPDRQDSHFQTVPYGLYALRHLQNNGLKFKGFRVPRQNLLTPGQGDGLTIAYHGLNLGRVSLCAAAAGSMRVMLANLLPWARFRRTYGAAIASRELVRRRIARLAALIIGCDALVDWCSWLLDQGYRGEMECIIAKIFGSEAQKEAAVELIMKTHGGRAFLRGHQFGDNVHEYLAPCIYEGEGEILGLGFFKSLIKDHGRTYFEPIGRALQGAGLRTLDPWSPVQLWSMRRPLLSYLEWSVKESLIPPRRPRLPEMPSELAFHARSAIRGLQASRLEISGVMRKHQFRLADRQCRMAELSRRVQNRVVMLVTSLWAARQDDELVRAGADILCQDLERELSGRRPSDAYFRQVTRLGDQVAAGAFPLVAGIEPDEILRPYDQTLPAADPS